MAIHCNANLTLPANISSGGWGFVFKYLTYSISVVKFCSLNHQVSNLDQLLTDNLDKCTFNGNFPYEHLLVIDRIVTEFLSHDILDYTLDNWMGAESFQLTNLYLRSTLLGIPVLATVPIYATI